MDIMRGFFHGRFLVKFAKLSKIFLEGVRLRHSVLLVYNERTFSRPCHHSEEPCIRNPWPPSNNPTERRGIAASGRRPLSVYPPRRVFCAVKTFESR